MQIIWESFQARVALNHLFQSYWSCMVKIKIYHTYSLFPQPNRAPEVDNAKLWASPAQIRPNGTPIRDDTGTGTGWLAVEPIPNWPEEFSPQENRWPPKNISEHRYYHKIYQCLFPNIILTEWTCLNVTMMVWEMIMKVVVIGTMIHNRIQTIINMMKDIYSKGWCLYFWRTVES